MLARLFCLLVGTLGVGTLAQAEDFYVVKRVQELDFVKGRLPTKEEFRPDWRFFFRANAMFPYAAVEDAEVYVTSSQHHLSQGFRDAKIAIRTSSDKDLEGTLFWPTNDAMKMKPLRFRVAMQQKPATTRIEFLKQKRQHYQRLLSVARPGSAWFRHHLRTVQRELGHRPTVDARPRQSLAGGGNSLEDTFALVSGGRALSENLQLDRALAASGVSEQTVPLKSLRGIKVREYEWGPLVEGLDPEPDSLASLIPDDQHALFLPGLGALVLATQNVTEHGLPLLNLAEPRAEDAGTWKMYEQQLGLSLNRGARLLGPSIIDSVAVTGSDPYFRSGTDIAFLLQAKHADVLKQLINAQVMLVAGQHVKPQTDNGRIGGISYEGVRTADRKLCSYRAVLGEAVVITNSLVQLGNLIDAFEGRRPSLASLQEYTFFRDRYPRDPSETGLLIISDKTIRRWCSPRWRIANSRRTRAVALMTEIQADHLDQLVGGTVNPGPANAPGLAPAAGDVKLHSAGVFSDQFGTLEFQTPIAEMKFDTVTKREADSYNRWRAGYERAWRNFFDPIAVRFKLTAEELTADVSVMPLISGSAYRTLIGLSEGARVGDNDGDPHHGALLHLALALHRKSPTTVLFAGWLATLDRENGLNPLSWINDTVALYVDDGEFFQDLANVEPKDVEDFLRVNLHRLPIALHVGVRDLSALTKFLAAARKFIETSQRGMTVWETLQYKEQPYVRISPSAMAQARHQEVAAATVFYAATNDSLIVTLDESVLKRSIDRRENRLAIEQDGKVWKRPGVSWLGQNLNVQVDAALLSYIERPLHQYYQQTMQGLCWNNLPILNEWHRRYPGRDPVALHAAYWQRKLVCPGGGRYRWNESWQTMESTVYGHPGEPKDGPSWPESLARLSHGNFGLTFEDDGLRAQIQIRRK